MKGLRLVIQNSDNQELFVKRIALPFKGADEFANITKALYTDLCVVVLAYQRSQEEGVSFKAMMDHVKKQTAEEVRKLKSSGESKPDSLKEVKERFEKKG